MHMQKPPCGIGMIRPGGFFAVTDKASPQNRICIQTENAIQYAMQ
jgi:hypothetical protein